ncbi:hypothetical protein BJ508DRAFT_309058 [Ascobolus immersus RN42]|uniref:Uncharacterized protein n=1 Tax=Ascobolus immersus RN42 TaxID=1160509 RepID=A0A3N4HYH5_ASCIM|nr:hypothetical protein BJ508DRAFT_309058 [Ascobolus immersus RN42]
MQSINPYIHNTVDLSQPLDSPSDPPPVYNPKYDEPPEHPHPDDLTDLPKDRILLKLRDAIKRSQIELVHLILDTYYPSVLDTNEPSPGGQTLLCTALNTGQNNLARELIVKYGANVETWSREGMDQLQRPTMRTPLMVACSMGNYAAAKMLIEEFGADDAVVGKDGMIALRCAVNAARDGIGEAAKCVEYLPVRRRGGWRRFKHRHALTVKAVEKTTRTVAAVGKFFLYSVPKFLVWTFPKWLGKKVMNGCIHTYHGTIYFFNEALPRALKATANGIAKLAGIMANFIASIPGHLVDLLKYLIFTAPGVIYKICKSLVTEILPKAAVETWNAAVKVVSAIGKTSVKIASWTWTLCTRRIPKWIWELAKWTVKTLRDIILVRLPALIKALALVLKDLVLLLKKGAVSVFKTIAGLLAKVASTLHTAVAFIARKLGRVTFTDVLNSIAGVLQHILVVIPITIFTGVVKGWEFTINAIPKIFGCLGDVVVAILGCLTAIILFIPIQICKLLWELMKWTGKGMQEMWVWVNPKSTLGTS